MHPRATTLLLSRVSPQTHGAHWDENECGSDVRQVSVPIPDKRWSLGIAVKTLRQERRDEGAIVMNPDS